MNERVYLEKLSHNEAVIKGDMWHIAKVNTTMDEYVYDMHALEKIIEKYNIVAEIPVRKLKAIAVLMRKDEE